MYMAAAFSGAHAGLDSAKFAASRGFLASRVASRGGSRRLRWLLHAPGDAWIAGCTAVFGGPGLACELWSSCVARRPPTEFVRWQPTAPSVNRGAPSDWLLQASCFAYPYLIAGNAR